MSTVSSATPTSSTEASSLASTIMKLLRANLQTYALIFAIIVIWVYFSYLTNGNFLSPQNFSNLLR